MRGLAVLALVGAALAVAAPVPAPAAASRVSYDRYSLRIDGRRVVLNSGEVHPLRIPDPRAWPGVLARLRASGLNAISIYVPWSYHEPAPGRFRYSGRYDVERFLADARDAGLYVVVRPGPYANAELDGGGFPSWLLGRPGVLRSTDARYTRAWKAWFASVLPRVARWQIGEARRGTVIALQIENEFSASGTGPEAYMRDLYATARADGIRVPLLHNDQARIGRFRDVVDLYGFDAYPYGFACCPRWGEATFAGLDGIETGLPAASRRSPIYLPEIQGGAIDLVTGQASDRKTERLYRALTGYGTVQDLTLLGQGTTMINRYMAYGGTSWGYLPFPALGSSYDYTAPVREWTGLGPHFDELRRVSGAIAVGGASLAATRVAPGAVGSDVPAAVRVRRSLVDGALHVFLRNAGDSGALAPRLRIGSTVTPPVPLPRRSARYLLAAARVRGWSIGWSTAEAMLATRRALVLFGDRGRRYAALLNGRRVDFTPRSAPRALGLPGRRTLVVVDRKAAARTWRVGGRVVIGPQLVTPSEALTDSVTRAYVLDGGSLRATRLAGPPRPRGLRLPSLARWRFARESPERRRLFDDRGWRAADRPVTTNRIQPLTSPVLDADAYRAPTGYVWYRGRFSGAATGVCLEGRHRYSAWLNGRPLGTVTSAADVSADSFGLGAVSQPARLRFPAGAVRSGANVLAVLTDDWGHSEDTFVNFGAKTPRGLISSALDRGAGASCGFRDAGAELPAAPRAAPSGGIAWKIRGGAMARYPNASGLFGEREGWYRTSFDDRRWKGVKLPDGGRLGRGEVGWYRSAFRLRLPRGVRAALGIELPGTAPAELFLNGVHVARIGRDRSTRFVLPPGTVRADGRRNVLALARWAVDGTGPVARPRLFAYTTEREVALPR